MRRIVIVAAGPQGVAAGVAVKRALPEHEINVVLPAPRADTPGSPGGPFAKRLRLEQPVPDRLAYQGIGGLEAQDIMTDFAAKEITVTSSRGQLPVRYTDLVLEVAAEPRLPRALQKAHNVIPWALPSFGYDATAADAAFAEACLSTKPLLLVGGGVEALDALLFLAEALAADGKDHPETIWLRTQEDNAPALDPHLTTYCANRLREKVRVFPVPGTADTLSFSIQGDRLASVTLPDGTVLDCAALVWASAFMGRHPVLREQGIVLDALGRITKEQDADPALTLMGSGAAVHGAIGALPAVTYPAFVGEENAFASRWETVDALVGGACGLKSASGGARGTYALRSADGCGVVYRRAGLTEGEASGQGREVVTALALALKKHSDTKETDGDLLLALVCDKQSRALVGVQTLGFGLVQDRVDAAFGMAFSALQSETPLCSLVRRAFAGEAGGLFAEALAILSVKLDTVINGVSPDELLASRQAGATFFTLDLRSQPDWEAGHLEDSCNIPLPQLKKRLQDEVPRFTPLVLVSSDGKDAFDVAFQLAGLGATDLFVLDGGMSTWPYALER